MGTGCTCQLHPCGPATGVVSTAAGELALLIGLDASGVGAEEHGVLAGGSLWAWHCYGADRIVPSTWQKGALVLAPIREAWSWVVRGMLTAGCTPGK